MNPLVKRKYNPRRPYGVITPYGGNILHYKNPWNAALWSLLFPGFGYLYLGYRIKGLSLIIWEILVNVNAHINIAIMYTFQGRFEQAKEVLDKRWAFLYIPVYTYAIYAGYRGAVDMNKNVALAYREKCRVGPSSVNILEMNFLDKRNPWVPASFSALMPGVGQLYCHRLIMGFFLLMWWIVICYFSHIYESVYFTFTGSFVQAKNILNMGWFLFTPSILGYAVYDAYFQAVEYNKLFDMEQSQFLKDSYQNPDFELPI